jgi:eukaryotic-like serine/threonine-protein kinase
VKVCSKCSESYTNDVAACPVDGAELKTTTDPYIGRTIAARYRLIRRLGVGGMASVYLARHVMIDRLSAIKILRQDFSLNPTHRERFLREARAVNRINHPNIVEITDCGEMDGVAYLVMEYVDGWTLYQELLAGALPWLRAARIAFQIASALGRAHQMGVVHRDLKPENILLVRPVRDGGANTPSTANAGTDYVKLTDFGIAKIIDAPALTFSEHLFGTPGYIAPECVEGLPVDRRTDIYSLGVVLYEMITAHLPYDAHGADLLTAPLVSAPIPPGARVSGLPVKLESLVLAMLSKNRDHRPTDAFAVQDALASLMKRDGELDSGLPDHSIVPHPPSVPVHARMSSSPRVPVHASLAVPPSMPRGVDSSPTLLELSIEVTPEEVSIEDGEGKGPSTQSTQEVGVATGGAESGGEIPSSSILLRWRGALVGLEISIDQARRALPADAGSGRRARMDRAAALANDARGQLSAMERAARVSAQHQAQVDRIEARGRDFRATLGHAIDELVHHRTRARLHASAVGALNDVVHQRMRGERRIAEALVWEAAALGVEAEQAQLEDEDLTHQISTLQARLEEANTELEVELAEAAGALEGSLAALRRLTGEFMGTLADAAADVRPPSHAV